MPTALAGDLARAITHEPNEDWPVLLEIVAYFGPGRTKRRSIEIDPNAFFGRGGHGAPMSGEQVIRMVDNLRKRK